MKNIKYFKILLSYLKDDKFKVFLYIVLVLTSYLQSLVYPFIWSKALVYLMNKDWNQFLIYLILWDGVAIIFNVLLQLPRDLLYKQLEVKFTTKVSKDLYKKVDNLPAVAFEEISTGEIINRLYHDPDRIIELLSKLLKMVSRLISVIIVIVIILKVSWIIGLELLVFAIVMYIISNIFYPRIKKIQEQIKKDSDEYVKKATQNISGIREIKALGIKKIIEDKIFNNIDNLYNSQKKIGKNEAIYYNLNNLSYFLLQFIILFSCGYLFFHGKITFETFVMIEMYIWRIDDAVESMSEFGVSYNKVVVSLKRINEIIYNELYNDEKFGNKVLKNIKGIIEFKKVKFKYKEDEDYTLKGLSMKLEPNKKIAIIGKSGMGKSTVFNLLLRYFDVNEGRINIDGVDIKELTEDNLRNNISIIRQSPYLFNQTILENFKLVKENVTLKEVREVCKKTYIDSYIESLPRKYDTVIGEGGINLSGGQKQRLAIARTLLKNTKIILFDEATSALDNESQEYIKRTIDNLVTDHTVIIVAHRLSTIMDADIIYVIDEGIVKDKGTHFELMNRCNLYKQLYAPELIDLDM